MERERKRESQEERTENLAREKERKRERAIKEERAAGMVKEGSWQKTGPQPTQHVLRLPSST